MDLKHLVDSAREALKADPQAGIGTATTHTVVRSGVTCDIVDGSWRLIGDEMPGDGGAGLGPDPGVFGRAALGSCLAMGYVMWAAYLGLPLDRVEVTVEADYDARGMLGMDDSIPAGWTNLRYTVEIVSSGDWQRLREMVEQADQRSSILDFYRRPHDIRRDLVINPS